jgi:hypothetical protein
VVTAVRTDDPRTGSRWYTHPVTGAQLASVTSILSATDGKPWLADWAARLAAEYAIGHLDELAQIARARGPKFSEDEASRAARRIRDLKADTGSYVHAVIEALILWSAAGGGSAVQMPLLPDHLAHADYDGLPLAEYAQWMVDGFLSFTSDFAPAFEAAEMSVFSPALGIAGTLDMIIRLEGYRITAAGRLAAAPGASLVLCVDAKTGRHLDGLMREQLAAYRRMTQALMPLGDLAPMPATDAGAVLHLRPDYARGYRLMVVSPADDETAWATFLSAVSIWQSRSAARSKPGKVARALRADGTMPQPALADLDGEGYGRVLTPLMRAGVGDLEQLGAMSAGECLAVRGIGGRSLDSIRGMLADHGLALRGEDFTQQAA